MYTTLQNIQRFFLITKHYKTLQLYKQQQTVHNFKQKRCRNSKTVKIPKRHNNIKLFNKAQKGDHEPQ
jgi:hypothetical protein